jgi:hypothetical protein
MHKLITIITLILPLASFAVEVPQEVREDALKRARVWNLPEIPISKADLTANPPAPDAFPKDVTVRCKFDSKKPNGNSPKFHCTLPSGEKIKVKPEIEQGESRTETAATRLMSALGFGADRMFLVDRVKCKGCPRLPYPLRWKLGLALRLPFESVSFKNAAIERKAEGTEINTSSGEGWAMFELDKVEPAAGGASRPEIDAFRLMAVFLAHWDNKAENQRLVCLSPGFKKNPVHCEKPFLFIQDLGRTFGPRDRNLEAWSKTPIWSDPATCTISMKSLPHGGATFADVKITEQGRQFLAGLLKQLTREQIRDLFTSARFEVDSDPVKLREKINAWVAVFETKVHQIADHPGCPN